MKFVYICSPLRGDIQRNLRKAAGYCLFAVEQGGLPLAPHLMFTRFLDDGIPEERQMGMVLGLELLKHSDELWVFGEKISEGMQVEIKAAVDLGIPVLNFNERCERKGGNHANQRNLGQRPHPQRLRQY